MEFAAILKLFGGVRGTIAAGAALLLGLLLAGQTLRLHWAQADVATAKADVATQKAEVTRVSGERDTATRRGTDLAAASRSWERVAGERLVLLDQAQKENTRLEADNAKAVAAAQAKQRDAERTLESFMSRYAAQIRAPDCAAALAQVDRQCPNLRDY